MNRLRRLFRRLSIRQKLMASVAICLLLPGLIAVNISNYLTKDVLQETAQKTASEAFGVVDLYMSNMFSNMMDVTNLIQFDDELAPLLKELGKLDATDDLNNWVLDGQKVTRRLERMVYEKDSMYISILLPNGRYFSNHTLDLSPSDIMNEPWFAQTQQLKGYDILWLGTHNTYFKSRAQESPYLITILRPLRTASLTYGYVVISIEEKQVRQVLQKYATTQEFALLNKDGRIMAHRNQAQIGDVFPFQGLPNQGEVKQVELDEKQFFLLSKPVLSSGWQLVSLTPYETAIGKISDIRQKDFIVQLFYVLSFALVLLYLLDQLMKPVIRISRVSAKVEEGDLEVRSHVRGDNEIGRLGHAFDRMLDRIESMIEQITREQQKKRMAELSMLQAQINPHFLFNILNSIRMKIMLKGDEENADLLGSLSTLLRMTINRNNEWIPLHEEVNIIEQYIKLLNFRSKETIVLELKLASDTLLEEVPRFLIQPLIENSYIHGLKQKSGTISIQAWKNSAETLYIIVEDNGIGMDKAQKKLLIASLDGAEGNSSHSSDAGLSGIGLYNVIERLRMIYRDQFDFNIDSIPGEGTKVTIQLKRAVNKHGTPTEGDYSG
ncbi:sensor histidine kinase [Paenibacillus agricola]|uniref:Histidine kinase n=1 Tax=Paenibacillus agricola TaxID=2716264 RepID=A0ABX0J4N9_9BACL|nr:histidine kinase [Paenibacillus agricola]NHN29081.1 histidine kinase [Paenibacillus agricola]